jgi:hypothetical protein
MSHTHVALRALSLSLIRRTACARGQFSGCSSTTNAYSETGQMTVCCQNLTLGALSSRSALSVMVGALFKKFGLFLNTPRINLRIIAVCSEIHTKCRNNLFGQDVQFLGVDLGGRGVHTVSTGG